MSTTAKPMTGRKVLLIALSAFGVIITVNLVMAWNAVSTFPGLEVHNSYVASQVFDKNRAAQEALGWTVTPDYHNGLLSLTVRDADGLPAKVGELSAVVGRTTHTREDITPDFVQQGGSYVAPMTLASGAWLVHLDAKATDGTLFRQRLELFVKG
ncbi:FixH family protein [Thioclava sp. BHET1]|nr:FixH family protein [Thioclava sp. BHET1]